MIVNAALQEDVDAIGLSILSGAHMTLLPQILTLLNENDLSEIPVFVGGIIPKEDIPFLESLGVTAVFGPGSGLAEITETVQETLARD